jgi:hypothetical protein
VHHNDDYEGHGRGRVAVTLELACLVLLDHGGRGVAASVDMYSNESMKKLLRMGTARMAFVVHFLLTIMHIMDLSNLKYSPPHLAFSCILIDHVWGTSIMHYVMLILSDCMYSRSVA